MSHFKKWLAGFFILSVLLAGFPTASRAEDWNYNVAYNPGPVDFAGTNYSNQITEGASLTRGTDAYLMVDLSASSSASAITGRWQVILNDRINLDDLPKATMTEIGYIDPSTQGITLVNQDCSFKSLLGIFIYGDCQQSVTLNPGQTQTHIFKIHFDADAPTTGYLVDAYFTDATGFASYSWYASSHDTFITLRDAVGSAPGVPTNVNAVASGTSAAVSWTAPASGNVAQYRVYRYDEEATYSNGRFYTVTTSTSVSDTGIPSDRPFAYAVEAADASGWGSGVSATSSEIRLNDGIAPAVTNSWPLGNNFTSTTTITATLQTNEYATCRYATTTGANFNSMTDLTVTGAYDHRLLLDNLSSGNHSYYIKCSDGNNIMPSDHAISFTVNNNSVLPISSANSPAGTYIHHVNVYLAITNMSGTIYYTTDGSNPTASSSIYTVPLTFSTSTTLKYFAKDTNGNSESINTAIYTIIPDTSLPSTPLNVTATAASASQIDLAWATSTDNIAVAGYKVYKGGSLLATSSKTSFSDTGLSPATAYNYKVSSYDSSGNESALSTQVTATTNAQQVLGVVINNPAGGGGGGGGGNSNVVVVAPIVNNTPVATSTTKTTTPPVTQVNPITPVASVSASTANNAAVKKDSDGDGLSDDLEIALGLDVHKADTDGDGFSDRQELLSGYDPLNKSAKSVVDWKFAKSNNGKILLQVENKGQAWYVNPADSRRYFLNRPADAFAVMRKLGLGAKHELIANTKKYPSKLSGKILIDVGDKGKAYYINPKDKRAYYLGRPEDAFNVMRKQGIGIKNADLFKILPKVE